MAIKQRYVNTASTAGGDGTTNNTTGATRAYATLAEWEANEQENLNTGGGTQPIVDCTGTADTAAFDLNGWTTSGSNYPTINGDNTTGIFSTSYYRVAGAGDRFVITENDCEVNRIQVNKTSASGYDGITLNAPGAGAVINLTDVIALDNTRTTGQSYLSGIAHKGQGTVNAFNCQALDFYGNNGAECMGFMLSGAENFNIYNSISAGSAYDFGGFTSGGTIIAKNCALNTNYDLFGGAATETADYCASVSGTGTNSVTITTWANEFVDSANHDYHLVASGALEGQGVGPATDANVPSPDVDGDARSGTTCDIGIDEYSAGTSVTVNQITETDLAQTITPSFGAISVSVAQNAETDLAQTITAQQGINIAVAQVAETDTAQSITFDGSLVQSLSQAIETDLAQALVVLQNLNVAVAQTAETDLAQALTVLQVGYTAVAQANETDLAQPITVDSPLTVAAGQVTETDLAQVIAPQQGVGIAVAQASETDLAQNITAQVGALVVSVGQVVETDLAQSISLAAVTYGGVYNAAEAFPAASTVTIELFDPIDGTAISVDDNTCPEMSAGGIYIWDTSKLTTQPAGYQEYAWKMTDGITVKGGIITMFDASDSTKLDTINTLVDELHKFKGLDAANPVARGGDGVTSETLTVDGKVLTITEDNLTRT